MIEELKAIIQQQDESVLPDTGDGSHFPDGGPWAMCWAWANDLQKRLGGRVKQYGFSEEENECSEIAQLAGGHDFAVVDGRFIVDGWAAKVEQVHDTGVLDLEEPEHFTEITRLFGDPRCWKDADATGEWLAGVDQDDESDLRNQLSRRFEAARASQALAI
jgi:hypothetical protein